MCRSKVQNVISHVLLTLDLQFWNVLPDGEVVKKPDYNDLQREAASKRKTKKKAKLLDANS